MLRTLQGIFILFAVFSNVVCADQPDGLLEIKKIADDVFLHTSYKELPDYGLISSNGLVVINGKDAYIIDTPWPDGDTEKLVQWIADSGFVLKASLSTHFHDDRAAGIAYLNQHHIDTYASVLTNQYLADAGSPVATKTFTGKTFSLLDGVIEVFYPGPGHTYDNVVVWLPQTHTLVGGCLIRSLAANDMGNTTDGSLNDWATSVKNIIDAFPEIESVIPGHGSIGGIDLLTHTQALARNFSSSGVK